MTTLITVIIVLIASVIGVAQGNINLGELLRNVLLAFIIYELIAIRNDLEENK